MATGIGSSIAADFLKGVWHRVKNGSGRDQNDREREQRADELLRVNDDNSIWWLKAHAWTSTAIAVVALAAVAIIKKTE